MHQQCSAQLLSINMLRSSKAIPELLTIIINMHQAPVYLLTAYSAVHSTLLIMPLAICELALRLSSLSSPWSYVDTELLWFLFRTASWWCFQQQQQRWRRRLSTLDNSQAAEQQQQQLCVYSCLCLPSSYELNRIIIVIMLLLLLLLHPDTGNMITWALFSLFLLNFTRTSLTI